MASRTGRSPVQSRKQWDDWQPKTVNSGHNSQDSIAWAGEMQATSSGCEQTQWLSAPQHELSHLSCGAERTPSEQAHRAMRCYVLLEPQVRHMVKEQDAISPGLIPCTLGVGLVCSVGRRVLHPGRPCSAPPAQHLHAVNSTFSATAIEHRSCPMPIEAPACHVAEIPYEGFSISSQPDAA